MLYFQVFSQQNYSVSWGVSNYDTLTNATYILPWDWHSGKEIDFEFDFPYFSGHYNSVIFNIDGIGEFPGSNVFNLFMYVGEYTAATTDFPIFRSWRYGNDTINGIKVLKIEWSKVGIPDDLYSDSATEHDLSFQVWFYENGIIDIHFGNVNLSNTPIFSETRGFIEPSGDSYGPVIRIGNFDLSEIYCISRTSANISVITDEEKLDLFRGTPTYGQYYRWTPSKTMGIDSKKIPDEKVVVIYPNPANDNLLVQFKSDIWTGTTLKVYTAVGQLVKSYQIQGNKQKIDISDLPKGIYVVKLSNKRHQEEKKK